MTDWSRVVRGWVPPVLFTAYERYKAGGRPAAPWAGVYDRFSDVPASGQPFDGTLWPAMAGAAVTRAAAARSAAWSMSAGDHAVLSIVAALTLEAENACTILDYGGGSGDAFEHVLGTVADTSMLRYHVIERPAVAAVGEHLWAADARVRFHTDLPTLAPHIVYVSSALQYVEDYRGLLQQLARYAARFVLLAKLSAGRFPTYATAQRNLDGASIPYWFINGDEIIAILDGAGYRLVFKSALDREYDQANFPAHYRMGRASNLLFARR